MTPTHSWRLIFVKRIRQQSRQQAPYTVLGVVGCATARTATRRPPCTILYSLTYTCAAAQTPDPPSVNICILLLGVVGCATARAAPLKAPSTTIVLVLYLIINPPVALSKLTLQQTVFSYCTLRLSHLSQLSSLSSSITSVVSVSGLP